MRHQLEYSWRHLGPEVSQDGQRGGMLLVGRGCLTGRDHLQIHGPQLAQDERVEQGAHVEDRGLALLGEPGQNHLDVVGDVAAGVQRHRLTRLLTWTE